MNDGTSATPATLYPAFFAPGPRLTLEDAIKLAAEVADPDFLERYATMKLRLAYLEAQLAAQPDA